MTNDETLYRKIDIFKKHGIDRREEMFNEEQRIGSWIYEMEGMGFNYRITDFQAALGLSQLKKLDRFKARRREIVNYYNDCFSDIDELILPYEDRNTESNFHLYILQVKKNPKFDRYGLFKFLQSLNYAPMVHYIPVHLLKYYRERFGFKIGDYPIAERFYEQAVSIPLYPSLTDSEVEKVVNDIKGYISSS